MNKEELDGSYKRLDWMILRRLRGSDGMELGEIRESAVGTEVDFIAHMAGLDADKIMMKRMQVLRDAGRVAHSRREGWALIGGSQ